jgi:hypothetical protein
MSESIGFKKQDEFKLPLTEEQTAMIEERFGERVDELTLSKHEVDVPDPEGRLRVLEINNLIFLSHGSETYIHN